MRIISLNVNGLRGMKSQGEIISEEALCDNLQKLKEFFDGLKINDEDVVVLQEVPHEVLVDKSVRPWLWEEHLMFQKFKSVFVEDYTIFYPRFLIDSNQCTIGLASKKTKWKNSKKQIIKYDRWHHFGNKLIELERDNCVLLGVHMNPCDEMWDLVINSLKENKVTFVVGDFNAYEERGEMKSKPGILRGIGYNSFIPSSVITDYKDNSSIDNFYVNKDNIVKSGVSVEVKKSHLFVSDHACCTLDIPNP